MRKLTSTTGNFFQVVYFICLLADILAISFEYQSIRYATKVLLILLLSGYFLNATIGINSILKKLILLALLFSWGGDVLLLFEINNSIFFLLGLSSFLIAHIFYIMFFHKIRIAEKVKPKVLILALVVIYYVALIYMLSPHLGDMKIPVRIYGIVITFMLMLAFHMLFVSEGKAGLLMAIGAALFVISDSLLAINKFYHAFSLAGVLVMLTYGLAQWLIVNGAITYLHAKRPLK